MALTNREKSMLRYQKYEKVRDAKGFKDSDVASGAGVYPSILSDWKTGRATPGFENIAKIIKFLGARIEDFEIDEV